MSKNNKTISLLEKFRENSLECQIKTKKPFFASSHLNILQQNIFKEQNNRDS